MLRISIFGIRTEGQVKGYMQSAMRGIAMRVL